MSLVVCTFNIYGQGHKPKQSLFSKSSLNYMWTVHRDYLLKKSLFKLSRNSTTLTGEVFK